MELQPRADSGRILEKHADMEVYTRLNAEATYRLVAGEQRETDKIGETANKPVQQTSFYDNDEVDEQTVKRKTEADKDSNPYLQPYANLGRAGEKHDSKVDGYTRLSAQPTNPLTLEERGQTDTIAETAGKPIPHTYFNNDVHEPVQQIDEAQKENDYLAPDPPPGADSGLTGEKHSEMHRYNRLNAQPTNRLGERRQTEKVGESANTPIQPAGHYVYVSEHDEQPVQTKNEADKDFTPDLQPSADSAWSGEKRSVSASMISLPKHILAIICGCILLLAGVAAGALVTALRQSPKSSLPGKVHS